jgi:serine/threonine protein kinase
MSTPPQDLPSHIGKYRVISRLGEGATSEVFLARDEFRQMDVAIKRLRQGVIDDHERLSAAFFGTRAGPESPPARIPSRESNTSPPLIDLASAEWQE